MRNISDKFGEKIKTLILCLCWTCVPCFSILPEDGTPVTKCVVVDAYQELPIGFYFTVFY
jgi:hypothetical protein